MINAQETLLQLTAEQKLRLKALLGLRRGLQWQLGDDELSDLSMVYIRKPERGPSTTELNNYGWSVAMLDGQQGIQAADG